MNYDDSDWTHEAAAASAATARPRRDVTLAGTLALGIVIGVAGTLLAVLAMGRGTASSPSSPSGAALTASPASAETAAASPAVQVAPGGTSPAALVERVPPAAGASASTAAVPATQTAAQDSDDAEPPPVAAAPSRPISAEEQKRRERAWAKFYRRPASCEGNPTTDQLIECANHFIRSKREFDERWKAGTL